MNNKFHLVINPGFEQLAQHELLSFTQEVTDLIVEKGGISFTAPLVLGLALNSLLKIPTKLLLRISEEKCKSFDELKAFVSRVPWTDYLSGPYVKVKVSSYKSKLYHKEQIADVFMRSLRGYFRSQYGEQAAYPKVEEPEVLLRIEHNFVGISINTSGEPLFKRGYKELSAAAPLRENLAFACLYKMWELSGFATSLKFLDPMCGSGTFLSEAKYFNQPLQREFGYQNFPMFKKLPKMKLQMPKRVSLHAEGWDLHTGTDFFTAPIPTTTYDFILFNPPYGHRLRLPKPPKQYWPELLARLNQFAVKRYGFLIPMNAVQFLPRPQQAIYFSNGGLDVMLYLNNRNEPG